MCACAHGASQRCSQTRQTRSRAAVRSCCSAQCARRAQGRRTPPVPHAAAPRSRCTAAQTCVTRGGRGAAQLWVRRGREDTNETVEHERAVRVARDVVVLGRARARVPAGCLLGDARAVRRNALLAPRRTQLRRGRDVHLRGSRRTRCTVGRRVLKVREISRNTAVRTVPRQLWERHKLHWVARRKQAQQVRGQLARHHSTEKNTLNHFKEKRKLMKGRTTSQKNMQSSSSVGNGQTALSTAASSALHDTRISSISVITSSW